MQKQWLSNTYLVADREGGTAAFIDAGGPIEPLIETVAAQRLTVGHILLTHHHYDHICEIETLVSTFPEAQVYIHPLEAEQVSVATLPLNDGDRLSVGELSVEVLHTPGHTLGMVALLVNGTELFTGDTLFKGSVGGVRAPGHTTFADLKRSVMDRLMALPQQTAIHPGHTDPTTVGEEWEQNSFIRMWRGLDKAGTQSCKAFGDPATLVLLGDDYDGGHKAWIRWPDGTDDIVPGSQISEVQ